MLLWGSAKEKPKLAKKKEDLLDRHKDKLRERRAEKRENDRGASEGKFENNILFHFRSAQQLYVLLLT